MRRQVLACTFSRFAVEATRFDYLDFGLSSGVRL